MWVCLNREQQQQAAQNKYYYTNIFNVPIDNQHYIMNESYSYT